MKAKDEMIDKLCESFDNEQMEFHKIICTALSKARNEDNTLIEYLEEQKAIIETDIAIQNDEEDKIKGAIYNFSTAR